MGSHSGNRDYLPCLQGNTRRRGGTRYDAESKTEGVPTVAEKRRFTLIQGVWYAMTMLPGYTDGYNPFHAPIRLDGIEPLKTGRSEVVLRFLNLGYAEGVQNFTKKVQMIDRHENYLVARGLDDSDRHYIFGVLDARWLSKVTWEGFAEQLRGDDLQASLNANFGSSPNRG